LQRSRLTPLDSKPIRQAIEATHRQLNMIHCTSVVAVSSCGIGFVFDMMWWSYFIQIQFDFLKLSTAGIQDIWELLLEIKALYLSTASLVLAFRG
jgi:hypothetical protein